MINSKSINGVTITILGSSNAPKFIYNLPDTWTGYDLKKWLKKYQDEINEAKNDLILVLEAKTFISRSKECIFNPDATSSIYNRTGIVGTLNGVITSNKEIYKLINQHLKSGTAKKLIDTEKTLMYKLGK